MMQQKNTFRKIWIGAWTLGCLLTANCGTKAADPTPAQDPMANRQDGLPSSSTEVEYADGWDSLVINANQAKTVIDAHAHWSSNHNCAQRQVFGAYAPATWNKIAKNLNSAVKGGVSPTPYCVEGPNTTRSLYGGTAEVQLPASAKRLLFEYKNGKICSSIVDHTVADDLYAVINDLILAADREDCPFANWH